MNPSLLLRPALAVVLTVCLGPGPAAGADPAPAPAAAAVVPAGPKIEGGWKWTFVMPDGTRSEPRVKLKRDGAVLSGTNTARPGFDAPVLDGRVDGNRVSWQVIREFEDRKVTTRYRGTVEGETIKGTIESDWTGEFRTYPWEARRISDNPTGTWQWGFGGRGGGPQRGGAGGGRGPADPPPTGATGNGTGSGGGAGGPGGGRGGGFMTKATLSVEGDKVTGRLSSFGRDSDVEQGRFADGVISFELVRERDGVRSVTRYQGRVDGDVIKGTVEMEFGGVPRTMPWEAARVSQ